MDALAISYAGELARWNTETSIIVPGAFTSGTNHFAHSGSPADKDRLAEYEAGPTKTLAADVMKGFEATAVPDADVLDVAEAIVKVGECLRLLSALARRGPASYSRSRSS
jgi:hypothetical protein